jgi:ribosomal protein S27AE
MGPKDDATDDFLDRLAAGLASGQVRLVGVRTRVCGRCKEGTLVSRPTPNWMNRWVCDHCGAKVSR